MRSLVLPAAVLSSALLLACSAPHVGASRHPTARPTAPAGPFPEALGPPADTAGPAAEDALALAFEGRVLVADAPPTCLAEGTCRAVRFRRPEECEGGRAYWKGRKARVCHAERWRTVYVDQATGDVVQATPPGPRQALTDARGGPGRELWEIIRQWRRCEPEDDPGLQGAPDVLKRHPDPDLGVCTLFRPDVYPPPDLSGNLGLKRLDTLHPYVADAARELVARGHAAGVPIRIISTYRPYSGRGASSWHAWGTSIDINLVERASMRDAKAHLRDDADKWATLREIIRDLAFWWGGDFDSRDIFHLEWHPGHGGRLKPDQRRAFFQRAGRKARDYKAVWPLFEPRAARTERKPARRSRRR